VRVLDALPPERVKLSRTRQHGRFAKVIPPEAVQDIRATIAASQKHYGVLVPLSKRYGVSITTISRIAAGLRRASV